jgi:photosystem II stability/assembly factor-like uncharacterized protein
MQDSIFCLGGMQDNRSAFYQGSVAWYKTFLGDGFWCAINAQNDNICYTEYTYGSVYRSVNRGVSFNSISPPGAGNSNNYCFSAPFIACKSNSNIMYVGGVSIYKSTNGGTSWLGPYGSFNSAKILSMDASATSADTLYCGTIPVTNGANATIWRSVNGGLNWTDIGGGILPNRYPTDIFVNPNNSQHVYAVFGGFGNPHVFRSTNGGTTWQNITGNLPDIPHQTVCIDPLYTNNIYVGNDLGVYVTTNSGTNWYQFSTGMPYALVFDLTIVYPNRNIRAATHGNGIWQRKLAENPISVEPVSNQLPQKFALYQNYPNPFNPVTYIKFDIPIQQLVKLIIYDINGREVKTLLNKSLSPGSYSMQFNASNLSSGVYFYRLETDNGFADSKKMIVAK